MIQRIIKFLGALFHKLMHHVLCFLSGFVSCATDSRLTFLFFHEVLWILRRYTSLSCFFNILIINFDGRRWHPFLILFDLQLLVSFRNRYILLAKWNFKGSPRCFHIVIRYIVVSGRDIKKEHRTASSRVVGGHSGWSRIYRLAWVWRGGAPELRPLPTMSFAQ